MLQMGGGKLAGATAAHPGGTRPARPLLGLSAAAGVPTQDSGDGFKITMRQWADARFSGGGEVRAGRGEEGRWGARFSGGVLGGVKRGGGELIPGCWERIGRRWAPWSGRARCQPPVNAPGVRAPALQVAAKHTLQLLIMQQKVKQLQEQINKGRNQAGELNNLVSGAWGAGAQRMHARTQPPQA